MASVDEVAKTKFDYVIVGGGTSGLTLAARLAANVNITILVLEAGPMNLDDPKINVSGFLGQLLGDPKYDWMFETSPQKFADGERRIWSRGKTLGGSSAVNFFLWSKPAASNINAWEELGNPGWNWDRYMQASLKTERFTPPASDRRSEWRTFYQPASHGTTGPLETTFAHSYSEGDLVFHKTLENLGIKKAKNILGGDPIGWSMSAMATSATNYKRSFSAQAFYLPNKEMPNLRVLCNAFVRRLLTKAGGNGLVAEGVEFEYDGKLFNVFSKGEIILCSGSIKTPQILELSGIGDRAVLQPLGIETKIHLPGVGSNVQEHIFTSIGFEIDSEHAFATTDKLRNPILSANELKLHPHGEGLYCLATNSLAFIPLKDISSGVVVNEIIAKQRKYIAEISHSLPPGLKEQYDLQLRFLNGESADCELIFYPGYFPPTGPPDFDKCYSSIMIATQHPFSRGTIHITSSDPRSQAEIDPRYFKEEIDRQILRETFNYARKIAETKPLKDHIVREVYPGPQCQTEDEINAYLNSSVGTFLHTIGSASMLPREHNGVVDNKLRVYGTENIRIADLSVVPIHFCSHSQATAYALGEIAAEIILDSTG